MNELKGGKKNRQKRNETSSISLQNLKMPMLAGMLQESSMFPL